MFVRVLLLSLDLANLFFPPCRTCHSLLSDILSYSGALLLLPFHGSTPLPGRTQAPGAQTGPYITPGHPPHALSLLGDSKQEAAHSTVAPVARHLAAVDGAQALLHLKINFTSPK